MRRRLLLLAPFSLALARAAEAHSFTLGPIEIGHPWAEPSVTEEVSLFLALGNRGSMTERLVGGTTPIAAEVQLRAEDGTPIDYIDLFPKRPLALRPGHKYIALLGLKQPLALDDTFPLTLHFAPAGDITVTVTVQAGPEQ